MKLTKEHINQTIVNRKILLIGEFIGTSYKARFRCLRCDDEWESFVTNIIHKQRGCPKCARNKKLTIDDIVNRLEPRGISLISDYVSSSKNGYFGCKVCNYEWKTRVGAVLHGQGCPKCAGNSKPSLDELSEIAQARAILFLGPYVNNATKTKWQCKKCELIWEATPGNVVVAKTGCPKCAKYGFDPSLSAHAYVLSFGDFIKYGITNYLEQRLKQHTKNGEYLLVDSVEFYNGLDAMIWEKVIKSEYGGNYIDRYKCPDGWTETLPVDYTDEIIRILHKHKEEKYAKTI
jgi:hypothetical protein